MTRKNTPLLWTSACQNAFEILKEKLISAPILAFPDFSLEFILHCDVSTHSLGNVLAQIQNGSEVVIAYSSRVLLTSERNYSATEREALAVLEGTKVFQRYLYGNHFTVLTDKAALKWLMFIKQPTGKLARRALTIQQFSFTIKHRADKTQGNADTLSRRPQFPTVAAIKTVNNSGFQAKSGFQATTASVNFRTGIHHILGRVYIHHTFHRYEHCFLELSRPQTKTEGTTQLYARKSN